MTKHYLYSTFSHFDNGEINVLSSGINELYALQSAFNLAAGTELSDQNMTKQPISSAAQMILKR